MTSSKGSQSNGDPLTEVIGYGVLIILGLFLGFVPILVGVLWFIIGRLFRLRWGWSLLVGATALAVSWWITGGAAAEMYRDGLVGFWKTVREDGRLSTHLTVDVIKVLTPLAVPAGILLAGVFEGYMESMRPWWSLPTRPGAARLMTRLGRSRAVKLLQEGKGHPTNGFALGVENGQLVTVTDNEANMHGFIVGATGSGKTTTILTMVEGVIARGLPVILIDLKGDPGFVRQIQQAADRYSRSATVWTLSGPTHWNPVRRGDPTELKDKIIGLETWTEPHYQRAAERYLQLLFTLLEAVGEAPTLERVVDLLHPPALEELAREPSTPEVLSGRVRRYLDTLDRSQLSGIQGLAARLGLMVESRAGEYLQEGPEGALDLLQAVEEGQIVVFSLDSQKYGSTAAQVGGLIIQDLKCVAGEMLGRGSKHLAYLVIDEFSALAGEHLLGLLARARSSGLCCFLATQELSDLAKVDPNFVDQVLGNVNLLMIHRQNVPENAERLASVAGTESTWQETIQIEQESHLVAGRVGSSTGLGSLRRTEQFVVHPNLLKSLGVGRLVVIRKAPKFRVQTVDVVPAQTVGGRFSDPNQCK